MCFGRLMLARARESHWCQHARFVTPGSREVQHFAEPLTGQPRQREATATEFLCVGSSRCAFSASGPQFPQRCPHFVPSPEWPDQQAKDGSRLTLHDGYAEPQAQMALGMYGSEGEWMGEGRGWKRERRVGSEDSADQVESSTWEEPVVEKSYRLRWRKSSRSESNRWTTRGHRSFP